MWIRNLLLFNLISLYVFIVFIIYPINGFRISLSSVSSRHSIPTQNETATTVRTKKIITPDTPSEQIYKNATISFHKSSRFKTAKETDDDDTFLPKIKKGVPKKDCDKDDCFLDHEEGTQKLFATKDKLKPIKKLTTKFESEKISKKDTEQDVKEETQEESDEIEIEEVKKATTIKPTLKLPDKGPQLKDTESTKKVLKKIEGEIPKVPVKPVRVTKDSTVNDSLPIKEKKLPKQTSEDEKPTREKESETKGIKKPEKIVKNDTKPLIKEKLRDELLKKFMDEEKKKADKVEPEKELKNKTATVPEKKIKPTEQPKQQIKEESKKPVKEEPKKPMKEEPKKQPKEDKSAKPPAKTKSTKETVESKKPPAKSEKKDAKKVTKKKTTTERRVSQRHFERLYYSLPSFAPNYTRIENVECKVQGQIFTRQLKSLKLWAMKMLDSTAKIPSGLLHGNINQLGDYDQCLDINTKIKMGANQTIHVNIQGKYCLTYVDLEAVSNEMNVPVNLALGRNFIRSRYRDPGHFIPRFTTIRWALCLPDACTAEDAEQIMRDSLRPYNFTEITGLRFRVYADDDECSIKKPPPTVLDYEIPTFLTIGFFVIIAVIIVTATLRDFLLTTEPNGTSNTEKLFMSFSLKRTVAALLKENGSDEITCIHGIRSFGTIMLYLAHKLIPLGALPFSNRTDLTELANGEWSSLFRGSLIYTDSFLFISGVLSAYNMSNDMEKKQTLNWRGRIVSRYIRLTPALAAVVLFYAYLFELMGEGPLWNSVILKNAELCKNGWWKNLLYIQNFSPFEEMCCTQTHQLALDMQLSLLSPILVWFWYKKPLFALLVVINLHILSFGVRFYFTTNYQLSLFIFHGISISQLYRTANKSYGQTLNRATPYISGVCLGILLRDISKRTIQLPKLLSLAGWLSTAYFAAWTVYTPAHMARRTYQYDVIEAAQYAALASVAWSLALSWIIFYCFVESASTINQLLSNRFMIVFSRISYSVYLVQFIVFFYNIGTVRTSSEFSLLTSVSISELVIILLLATILTLALDLPMQDVKAIVLARKQIVEEATTTDKSEDEKVEAKDDHVIEEYEDSDDEFMQKIVDMPVDEVRNLLRARKRSSETKDDGNVSDHRSSKRSSEFEESDDDFLRK